MQKKTISIPRDKLDELKNLSKKNGIPVTIIILLAINEYLKNYNREEV